MKIQCDEKEKRNRIVSQVNRNMFVEAGAGAGKTTLIKDRIINQLKSGMRPEEIVVITFTNAATQELRSRIINAALEEERKTDLPKKQVENLRLAVENIDRMQISTIHSFCSRILKERSLDVGMPMDIDLIKASDYERLKKESFVRWAEGLRESDWDLLLKKDIDRKKAVDRLENLTGRLIGVDDEQIGRIKMALPPIETKQWDKEASDFVQEFIKEILRLAGEAYESQYTSLDQIKHRLLKIGKDILAAIGKNDNESIVKTVLKIGESEKILKAPTQDHFKQLAKAQKEKNKDSASDAEAEKNKPDPKAKVQNAENILKGINDFLNRKRGYLEELLGRNERTFYDNYIEYAKKARAYFYNYIGPEVLTNDTLIWNARKLLEESKESQRYFSGKFKCIYVDEYQDTDHVQDAFIRLLAEDPDQQGALRDGALFIVGDPKQSIYRFRGAEPEVYFRTKSYFEGLENADVIELQDNYRSSSSIVDWVNAQFQNKAITPGQAYVPMKANKFVPSGLVDDKTLDGIYYLNSITDKKQNMDPGQDAEIVAKLIWNLVNEEHYLIEDGTKRRIGYSDILILCMWTGDAPYYVEKFRQYGIPVLLNHIKFTVGTEWYMKAFCRIYQYLIFRYDKRNSAAARESLVALGMEMESAERTLKELAEKTGNLSPVGLLYFLEANWKLLIPQNSDCSEGIRQKVQARITQMVGNIVSSTNGSSHEIKKALSEYLNSSIEHELVLEEDVDAVRFINLHKAKGLEGNIVIWADRFENMIFKKDEYRSADAYYPSVRENDKVVWCAYNYAKEVEKEAEQSHKAETIRLEYVAVTRAKSACIFMDAYGDEKKEVLFGEGYTTENAKSITDMIDWENVPTQTTPASSPEKIHVVSARCARADLSGALYESVSPSDLERSAGGKKKEDWTPGQHSRPVGAVFGTTMHRAFELLIGRCLHTGKDSSPCNDEALVRSCYVQAIQENISDIPAEQAADYEDALSGMIKELSAWWKQLQTGAQLEECYQELPFSYFDKTDNKTVWNHGFADLVLKMTNGEYLIIDYKSDSDEGYESEESFVNGLRKKYGPQIEAYKDAVETLFLVPREKIKARLIWFTQKEDNTYQCKETEIQTEISP